MPYRPSRHLLAKCAAVMMLSGLVAVSMALGASAAVGDAASRTEPFLPGGPWSQIQGGATHLGEMEAPMGSPSPQPLAPPYEQAWRFDPTDSAGVSGPVVSGETVYALGEESVYAVDLATGEARWSVDRETGPLTVPAVTASSGDAAPRLVYTQGVGDKTELAGLNTGSQQQTWTVPLEDDAIGDVTLDGGTALVGNSSGKVFAVDVASGKVVWSVVPIKGRVEVAPAVSGGVVYVVVRSTETGSLMMLALDEATGAKKWEAKLGVPGTVVSGLSVTGTSVLAAVYSPIYTVVDSLSTDDGAVQWTSGIRSASFLALVRSNLAVSDGRTYVTDITGGVYGIDVASGDRAWDFQMDSTLQLRSSPVVTGGFIVSGFDDGRLAAFYPSSGHLAWLSEPTGGEVKSLAVAPGVLVAGIGGDKGGLVAFKHSETGKLTDVVSPTTMAVGSVVLAYLAALILAGGLILGLGKLLNERLRRFAAPEDDEAEEPFEADEEE